MNKFSPGIPHISICTYVQQVLCRKAAILYCTIVIVTIVYYIRIEYYIVTIVNITIVIFDSKIGSWALFQNRNSCKATIRK